MPSMMQTTAVSTPMMKIEPPDSAVIRPEIRSPRPVMLMAPTMTPAIIHAMETFMMDLAESMHSCIRFFNVNFFRSVIRPMTRHRMIVIRAERWVLRPDIIKAISAKMGRK